MPADLTDCPNAADPSNVESLNAKSNADSANTRQVSIVLWQLILHYYSLRNNNLQLLALVLYFYYCVLIKIYWGDILSVIQMLMIMLVITVFRP